MVAPRFDLEKMFAALEPQTVNREGKRDREDVVEVPGMARGMTREALGQAMLLGYGDDIEGYLTSRHPDDIKRERYAFSDENRVAANAAYAGGILAGGGIPRIIRTLAAAPKQQLDEMPPRFEPDLRQAMRNADQAAPADEATAQLGAQLEMLLNQKLPPRPEYFPGAFGAQSENNIPQGGDPRVTRARAGGPGRENDIPPADIFAMLAGASPDVSSQAAISPEEQALRSLSPTDAVKFGQELQQAAPVSDEQRAQNLRTTGWDALSATPGPGNLIAASDAVKSAGDAYDQFSQGNLGKGALATALAALSSVGAVTGLPMGRLAGDVAKGASSRLNTFVGPEAKTADKVALQHAEALKKAGADRDEIWRATGWAWDERGLPYFEVDDSAAKLAKPGFFSSQPEYFDQFMDHPELFKARPDIAELRFSETGAPGSGFFLPSDELSAGGRIDVGPGGDATRKSIGLHEGQHAADLGRGASYGANSSVSSPEVIQEVESVMREKFGDAFSNWQDAHKNYQDLFRGPHSLGSPEMDEAFKTLTKADQDLAAAQGSRRAVSPASYAYQNNPGEARARNTEARRDFSALDRRDSPPWHTLDVDEADILSGAGKPAGPSEVFMPLTPGSRASDEALSMRLDNRPLRDIYNKTGNFIGPDGVPRREIIDSLMKVNPDAAKPGTQTKLGELIDHPELFKARPEYRDLPVNLTDDLDWGGKPIARTGEGGVFQNSVEGDMRPGIAKNLQYQIARDSQLPAGIRHGPNALPDAVTDAIKSLEGATVEGAADRRAMAAYVDRLSSVRADYLGDLLNAAPKTLRRIEEVAQRKSSGSAESRIVRARATLPPDEARAIYPYAQKPSYFPRNPGKGLAPFEELWPLPPEGATGEDLMEFIRNWHKYGSGRKSGISD